MDEQQKRLAEELLFAEVKKPSFAKQLYFGVLDASAIFPYPKVCREEKERTEEYIKQVQAFADKEIDPDAIDRNASIPPSVLEGMGRLGILGMTIPKEYGGLGFSQYAYCRTVETLARRCGSTALFVNAHQSVGLKALLLFGSDAQRRRWLPPLARGDQFAAFSLTEPNAGSDASGVETRAVYIPEKNVYRINGRKQWTTNGSIAKVLTVMAQTRVKTPSGEQDKITAFLVTPDMPGFHILNPGLEKVGMRGTRTANLEFKDLDVPAENILGPIGGGLRVCLTVLDYGRTTFGSTCTGSAKFLVEHAIHHARNRFQFKRPLGSFALVKEKIAVMSALTYAMDATTYMTAGLVDGNIEDFMLEAAILKVFASDSLWRILYETMQIYGGLSFFTDHPFERMMRDARLNMIGEGSNEVMRAFIGVVGMRDVGLQLKNTLEAFKNPLRDFGVILKCARQRLNGLKAPHAPIKSPLLTIEAVRLGKAIRSFGFCVTKLLAKYREEVLEKQLELNRISNGVIGIYTVASVLSKLDADLERVNGDAGKLGNDVAVAKLYCRLAFESIDENLGSLFHPRDALLESVSDQITGIKFP